MRWGVPVCILCLVVSTLPFVPGAPPVSAQGVGWGTEERVDTSNAANSYVQVGVDSDGDAIAVWQQLEGACYSVWANRYIVGTGWGAPEPIAVNNTCSAELPHVAVDARGNGTAVWPQWDGARYDIWANRYVVGTGWGTAELIETDTGSAGSPRVAADSNGDVMAVWSQSDGIRYHVWANRYIVGTGWGTPELVETDNGGNARNPQVDVDPAGNATAAWEKYDGTRYNVWANRYARGAGWGTAQLLEMGNAGDALSPQAAVDRRNNATVVWQQWDGLRWNVWAIRYVVGAGWGAGQPIEMGAKNAESPQIAVDQSGNVTAVWSQWNVTQDIYANRFTVGAGWGTPSLVETNDTERSLSPQVGVDPNGSAVAVWEQFDGTLGHIAANRYAIGAGWGTAQFIETNATGNAMYPQIGVDSRGDALAVWWVEGGLYSQIWANRYTANSVMDYEITVTTSPAGLQVDVNGTSHTAPYTFWCHSGSTFLVGAPSPQNVGPTPYVFLNWSDGGAQSHVVTCANSVALTVWFGLGYAVTLATLPPGLQVSLDGNLTTTPYTFLCVAGSIHTLDAPSPQIVGSTRFVFENWSDSGSQSHTIGCAMSENYTAAFSSEYQVTVATSPSDLQIAVDGNTTVAPQVYWWPAGSAHELDAPSPQVAGATRYVFSSWSDGGAQIHAVVVSGPATFSAVFATQVQVTVTTSPVPLNVTVNGTSYPSGATFWFDPGSPVVLFAPSPQSAAPTTQYAFVDWQGGPSTQSWTVTVTGPANYTANYRPQYLITLDTNPTGLGMVVDTSTVTAPFSAYWDVGSVHSATCVSPQFGGAGTRYSFLAWSDGSPAAARTIVADGVKTLICLYAIQYFLSMSANFGTVSPGNGWHDAGTVVLISATGPPGSATDRYRFRNWTGDYQGTSPSGSIAMDGPKTLHANWIHEFLAVIQSNPPGQLIDVDGVPTTTPANLWWAEGTDHLLTAPLIIQVSGDTRLVFASWSPGGSTNNVYVVSGVVGPETYTATFVRQYRITVVTVPATGPAVLVDGAPYTAPVWLDEGTSHTFDAQTSPQSGGVGIRFVFGYWETSSTTALRSYTAVAGITMIATYDTQYQLTITSPYGNPQCQGAADVNGCWYLAGLQATAVVTTPFNAPDGHVYALTAWTGNATGTDTSVTLTMDGPKAVTATWQQVSAQYRVTIDSSPSGLQFVADGTTYTAPQEFPWVAGSSHTLSVPSPQAGSAGVRFRWSSWSDLGAQVHSILVTGDVTLTIVFQRQFLLTLNSEYGSPACDVPDCWYDEGSTAGFSVSETDNQTAGGHFRFEGWIGDANITSTAGSVTMDRPKTVMATWREVSGPSFLEAYWWLLVVLMGVTVGLLLAVFWRRSRRKDETTEEGDSKAR